MKLAKEAYAEVSTKVSTGKVIITGSNIWDLAYREKMHYFSELSVEEMPLSHILYYMVQRGLTLPHGSFLTGAGSGKPMVHGNSESMWRICCDPTNAVFADVFNVFFTEHARDSTETIATKFGDRYISLAENIIPFSYAKHAPLMTFDQAVQLNDARAVEKATTQSNTTNINRLFVDGVTATNHIDADADEEQSFFIDRNGSSSSVQSDSFSPHSSGAEAALDDDSGVISDDYEC